MGLYDDETGATDIYLDSGTVSGENDPETGAARARQRQQPAKGTPAIRAKAFLPSVAIGAGATAPLDMKLNFAFKAIGMRLSGQNQDKLLYNGATIRGRPQEANSGSTGCEIFTHAGETFFEEWDTANPNEQFSLSFTNTHTASVTPTGYLIGYRE
ncbi:MAG TPA: hypothetical protein VFQ35_05945 [Polyangiaceae bacterium]|nr:hypothetical protein [Polyangiaceae bacterium]